MSNDVYPVLPGLTFSTVRSVVSAPVVVKTTPSQREYRGRDSILPRYKYTLPYEFLRSRAAFPELQTLVGFYNAHGGMFDTFLFTDPDDSTAVSALLGAGDGTTTAWKALRSFGGYVENIEAFSSMPAAYVDGVRANLFRSPTDFTGAGWTTDSLITVNVDTPPGASSAEADQVTDNRTDTLCSVSQSVAVVNDSTPFTASVYVKKTSGGTSPTLRMQINLNPVNPMHFVVELNTDTGGILVSTGPATVVDFSTYWRVSISTDGWPRGNTQASVDIYTAWAVNGSTTMNASITGGAILWGAKLEVGATTDAFSRATYTVDQFAAKITFSSAPGPGAVLTWSGSFYRRVRFNMDTFDATKFMQGFWEQKRVELISVKT